MSKPQNKHHDALQRILHYLISGIENNDVNKVDHDSGSLDLNLLRAQTDAYLEIQEIIEMELQALEPPEIDYSTATIAELGVHLKWMKEELEAATRVKAEFQKSYDFLSIDVIPEKMDEQGVDSIKITGVGRLALTSDIRCNILAANKKAVEDWLRENGHEAMISETVNASTFKAFVKEQMRNEGNYPKDLINVAPYTKANITKV